MATSNRDGDTVPRRILRSFKMGSLRIDPYDQAENGKEMPNQVAIESVPSLENRDGRSPPVQVGFPNPAPLGLMSFATSTFIICITGVHARGMQHSNITFGVLVFFGGLGQFTAGIMEWIRGNVVGEKTLPQVHTFLEPI